MSPGVECLTLDREAFKQHIGDLEELQEKDYGDRDRMYAIRQIENKQIQLLQQEREIERGKGSNELGMNVARDDDVRLWKRWGWRKLEIFLEF